MRKGYTKRVLQAQIQKYEKALKLNDGDFKTFTENFGIASDCPVCIYRHRKLISAGVSGYSACKNDFLKDCLAMVNGERCNNQRWYDDLTLRFKRTALKTRLKYWQAIYKEKYPGVK